MPVWRCVLPMKWQKIAKRIGNIVHQWRQPINALTLVLANIKDAYEYDELNKEYLDNSGQKRSLTGG
jgi:hypothetical protein